MADFKKKKFNNKNTRSNQTRKSDNNGENEDVDESSPIIQMFRGFQQELDQRYDKHERIVKLSRDITIDSKRAIFLLHRADGNTSDIFQQTEEKLAMLENTKFRDIARELVNTGPHQFIKAYTAGLQEYIEALTFYYYLKENKLLTLKQAQERLTFTDTGPDLDGDQVKQSQFEDVDSKELPLESDNNSDTATALSSPTISVPIPPVEFFLGIADLTGELMRKAINSVGSGDLELPFEICTFLQEMESAFVSLGNRNREINRKLTVLKQSLRKVETACYTLKVRGSEIPKHMLVDVLSKAGPSSFIDESNMEENGD